MNTNRTDTKNTTTVTERPGTIHAELLFTGCGAMGNKPKTMEDLWFAEQDHKRLTEKK